MIAAGASLTALVFALAPSAFAASFTPDGWFTGGLVGTTTTTTSTGSATSTGSGTKAGGAGTAAGGAGAGFTPDGWFTGVNSGTTTTTGSTGGSTGTVTGTSTGSSTGIGTPVAGSQVTPPPNISADVAEIVSWTNGTRAQNGLPPLQENALLAKIALLKCQDMVVNNYFGHISPTYGSPLQMQQAFGVNLPLMGGENLSAASSPALAYDLMLWSPGHLANLLNPGLTEMGAAVVSDNGYGVFVCQELAGTGN